METETISERKITLAHDSYFASH